MARPHADVEVDAIYRKLRSDTRILLWMTSASLVMTALLVIKTFFWAG